MSRGPLLVLLTVTLGCATTPPPKPGAPLHDPKQLPALPASHAHLAQKLPAYARLEGMQRWFVQHPPRAEVSVLDPADAPRILTEAREALAGQPTYPQVLEAWADLSGACRAHLLEACAFLREHYRFGSAKSLSMPPGAPLREELHRVVLVTCTLGREGRLRDCTSVENVRPELAAPYLRALQGREVHPSFLAGHPVDLAPTSYSFRFSMGSPPPVQEQLGWAALRARENPRSPWAWRDLAQLLAEHRPEGPDLHQALTHLRTLDPTDWWANSELALRELKAGRPAQALPLADEAWAHAPFHPYVLEVYAAAVAAAGRCDEAKAEQRRALELLPEGWPEAEQERFRATLADYEAGCTALPWSALPAPDTRMAAQHAR